MGSEAGMTSVFHFRLSLVSRHEWNYNLIRPLKTRKTGSIFMELKYAGFGI